MHHQFLGTWVSEFGASYPATGPSVYAGYLFDAVRIVQLGAFAAVSHGWAARGASNVSCFADASNRSLPPGRLRGVVALGVTGVLSFDGGASIDRLGASVDCARYGAATGGGAGGSYVRFATFGATAGVLAPSAPSVLWPQTHSVTPPADRPVLAGRVLRTGTLLSTPFVSKAPDGSLSGYVIDLARQLEPLLHVTFDFRVVTNMTYNQLTKAVQEGTYDCMFADTTITAARSVVRCGACDELALSEW